MNQLVEPSRRPSYRGLPHVRVRANVVGLCTGQAMYRRTPKGWAPVAQHEEQQHEQATLFGEGSRPKVRTLRRPDEMFEAMALTCGIKPTELTASGRGQLNRALAEVRGAGATAPMILQRGAAYRERFKHIPTPGALSRHWASLSVRPVLVVSVPRAAAVEPEGDYIPREELARRARCWAEERDMPFTKT